MLIAGFPAGSFQANCYLIALEPGSECIVVDPGEDASAQLAAVVAEHRLRPVAAVLTHGHLDHAASLQEVCRTYDMPGYVHESDEYMLDDPLAALSDQFRAVMAGMPIPAMRPAELRYLAEGDVLSLAGLSVQIDHTPGHTQGGVVLRLAAAADGPEILLTGDTLFAGSIGRTDLPGGSTDQLLLSIKTKLLTRDDDAFVLPGHGPTSTIGDERKSNPFLTGLG